MVASKRQKTEDAQGTAAADPSMGRQRADHIHDLTKSLLANIAQTEADVEAIKQEIAADAGADPEESSEDDSKQQTGEDAEISIATAHAAFELGMDEFSRTVSRQAIAARDAAVAAYTNEPAAVTEQPELFANVLLERIFGDMLTHAESQCPRLLLPFRPQMVGLNEQIQIETSKDQDEQAQVDKAFDLSQPDKGAFIELFCEQAAQLFPPRKKVGDVWPQALRDAAGTLLDRWVKLQHESDGKTRLAHTDKVVRPPYMEDRLNAYLGDTLDEALAENGNVDMEQFGNAVHEYLVPRAAELPPLLKQHVDELKGLSMDDTALFLFKKLRAQDAAPASA